MSASAPVWRRVAVCQLVPLLTLVACGPDTDARPSAAAVNPPADVDCGSQQFATVSLGEALAHVRAARVFATERGQRVALAKLEPMLVKQIEAEPDSNFRGAAWLQAETPVMQASAAAELQQIERMSDRWSGRGIDAQVEERSQRRRHERYTAHLESAVKAVDPRSPKRCAQATWQPIFEAALEAQAQ